MQTGVVYNIQRMSVHDGPGLRTTVFLKGCPLRCLWCSNPESQSPRRQILTFEGLCAHCRKCVEACPKGAIIEDREHLRIRSELCDGCGACVEVCPTNARVLCGEEMTVDQVLDMLRKDELFYRNSDGGVTFGGGEPTSSPDFLLALLKASQAEGYHTCIDTCGFTPWERLSAIIQHVDLVLFDCKHMDAERHKSLTRQDNALILANMRNIAEMGVPMRVRVPLIPGLNDSPENIRSLAGYLVKLGKSEVDVLPYHAFGQNKYAALGLDFPDIMPYAPAEFKRVMELFKACSLRTNIV